MNYLVIDLEMCRVKKLYRKTYKYASEIITDWRSSLR